MKYEKDTFNVPASYPDCYPTWDDEVFCAEIEFGHGSVHFEVAVALLRKFGYDG